MIQIIKNLISRKRKIIFRIFLTLILLLIIGIFSYLNFRLTKSLVSSIIENEKETHANEACAIIKKIEPRANYFLEKIEDIKDEKAYLDKNRKTEIITALRVMESDLKDLEFYHFNFYNNDLSIKFLSLNSDTKSDNLFSQITNLPLYGYRAIDSMENLLKLNYPNNSQLETSEIEFNELSARIKSIKEVTSICQ